MHDETVLKQLMDFQQKSLARLADLQKDIDEKREELALLHEIEQTNPTQARERELPKIITVLEALLAELETIYQKEQAHVTEISAEVEARRARS